MKCELQLTGNANTTGVVTAAATHKAPHCPRFGDPRHIFWHQYVIYSAIDQMTLNCAHLKYLRIRYCCIGCVDRSPIVYTEDDINHHEGT